MAFSRGNLQKRKKKNSSGEIESSSSCLLNENVFPGLNFLKNINNTKSTITTLKSKPNVVLSEKNIVVFDYSGTKNEKDLNILHATFSTMTPQTSTFILSSSRYVQDEFSIDIDIAGTFTFLNFMNGNLIVAKASSNLGNYDRVKWEGKFFIKTPQIEIFDKFSSSKNVDKIVNLIKEPSFSDWGIVIGDSIRFVGTKSNDDNVAMVIAIEGNEITLSEIKENENTIGLPIKIQHYRKCSSVGEDTSYATQEPIEVQFNKRKKSTQTQCPDGQHWMEPVDGNPGFCMEGAIHEEQQFRSRVISPTSVTALSYGCCPINGKGGCTMRHSPCNTDTHTQVCTSPRRGEGCCKGIVCPVDDTPQESSRRTSKPTPSTPTPRPSTPTSRTSTSRTSTSRTSTSRTSTSSTPTPRTPPSPPMGGGGY